MVGPMKIKMEYSAGSAHAHTGGAVQVDEGHVEPHTQNDKRHESDDAKSSSSEKIAEVDTDEERDHDNRSDDDDGTPKVINDSYEGAGGVAEAQSNDQIILSSNQVNGDVNSNAVDSNQDIVGEVASEDGNASSGDWYENRSVRLLAKTLDDSKTPGKAVRKAETKHNVVEVSDSESEFEPSSPESVKEFDIFKESRVLKKETSVVEKDDNHSIIPDLPAIPKHLDATQPQFSGLGGPPYRILYNTLYVFLDPPSKLGLVDKRIVAESIESSSILVRLYNNNVYFIAHESPTGQAELLRWYHQNKGTDFESRDGLPFTFTGLQLRNVDAVVTKAKKFNEEMADGTALEGDLTKQLGSRAYIILPKKSIALAQQNTQALVKHVRQLKDFSTIMVRFNHNGHLLISRDSPDGLAQLKEWYGRNKGKSVATANGISLHFTSMVFVNANSANAMTGGPSKDSGPSGSEADPVADNSHGENQNGAEAMTPSLPSPQVLSGSSAASAIDLSSSPATSKAGGFKFSMGGKSSASKSSSNALPANGPSNSTTASRSATENHQSLETFEPNSTSIGGKIKKNAKKRKSETSLEENVTKKANRLAD